MKKNLSLILLMLVAVVTSTSCKKNQDPIVQSVTDRKIRFQLYTNQNDAGNTSVIIFSLFIRDGNHYFLDSALAPMQIKDIPDAAQKLVFEKTIPANGNIDLAAGFHYEILNSGNARFTDTLKAGNTFKVIDYAFQ